MCRWERNTAAKLVTKLLAGDKSLQSVPSMPGSMSTALSKALGSLPQHLQGGVHPHHVLLELDDETKSHIVGAPLTPPTLADPALRCSSRPQLCSQTTCHLLLSLVVQQLCCRCRSLAPACGKLLAERLSSFPALADLLRSRPGALHLCSSLACTAHLDSMSY